MNFKITSYYQYITYILSLVVMFYSYQYQLIHPTCCDANSYVDIANHFLEVGIFEKYDYNELRLYGYPLFLSFFYLFFEKENAILGYAIFNCFSYIILSILISNKLKQKFELNDKILNIAFSLNILLFPYLVIPLADGLSVLLFMIISYLLLTIIDDLETKNKYSYILIFLYSYIIGFSIMVRPSNVCLILLIPLFAIFFFLYYQYKRLAILGVLTFGFLVAVAPQLYMNYYYFQKISFLPTLDLGSKQIEWGIQYIKYATNLSGIGTPKMYYNNPFALNYSFDMGLSWYFHNFEYGIKTIFLHIFNVFSFDYYFPYIYDLYPKYKNLTLFYSWFITFFGTFGIYELFKNRLYIQYKNTGTTKFLLFVILPIVFLSMLSILTISAVEIRFSLSLILILLPFAFYSFKRNLKNINIWIIFTLFIICAFLISSFVDLQKNIPYM